MLQSVGVATKGRSVENAWTGRRCCMRRPSAGPAQEFSLQTQEQCNVEGVRFMGTAGTRSRGGFRARGVCLCRSISEQNLSTRLRMSGSPARREQTLHLERPSQKAQTRDLCPIRTLCCGCALTPHAKQPREPRVNISRPRHTSPKSETQIGENERSEKGGEHTGTDGSAGGQRQDGGGYEAGHGGGRCFDAHKFACPREVMYKQWQSQLGAARLLLFSS